jgi:hypothetical protein
MCMATDCPQTRRGRLSQAFSQNIDKIERKLDNREERPRFAERYSEAALPSCEYRCVCPAVRAQRREPNSPTREWKALTMTCLGAILREFSAEDVFIMTKIILEHVGLGLYAIRSGKLERPLKLNCSYLRSRSLEGTSLHG